MSYAKSDRFLYYGYTFEQERRFKAVRDKIFELVQKNGKAYGRNRRCSACNSADVRLRVTTRDCRCRVCGHIEPLPPRF